MKTITTTIILFFALMSSAFANGYCDGRDSQAAIKRCYISNIQMQNGLMRQYYQKLAQSPKYTMKQKADLELNQLQWEQNVRQQCRSEACTEQSYVERNRVFITELNRHDK